MSIFTFLPTFQTISKKVCVFLFLLFWSLFQKCPCFNNFLFRHIQGSWQKLHFYFSGNIYSERNLPLNKKILIPCSVILQVIQNGNDVAFFWELKTDLLNNGQTFYFISALLSYDIHSKSTPSFMISTVMLNEYIWIFEYFNMAKLTFKMLLASWTFDTILKRFRSFYAKNLGSASQRAAKLLAVKVGGLKKKSAGRPWPHSNQWVQIQVCPWSNHSQSLMASNFRALWPIDSKFSALTFLKLCQKFKRLVAF